MVSGQLVLAHPTGHTALETAIACVGGPLAYLVGVVLFKHTLRGWYQPSHLAGIAALAAVGSVTTLLPPLALSALTTLVLVIVAGWETLSLKARQPPSPS